MKPGLLMLAVGIALGCSSPSIAQADADPLEIVTAYVAAYNARDIDAMAAMMHDDIMWIAVEEDGVAPMAVGKDDLTDQMRAYVASAGATKSTLGEPVRHGRFLSVTETATWQTADGQNRSQSAGAVYELEDGLIRRVWYYPAR